MVNIFLKIDGIEGESTDQAHAREIEALSFNWSESPAPSTSGSARIRMNDFTVQFPIEKASPKLFLACATGQHVKEAVLTARKPGAASPSDSYLKIDVHRRGHYLLRNSCYP